MPLEIKTADELVDPELEARWAARRADRRSALLRHVVRRFADHSGPASVEEIAAGFPDRDPDAVRVGLTELHEKDLLLLRDGRVELAYPFSAVPTSFTIAWEDGEERYACCAIDALGIAPMLGRRIAIRSLCHHCRAPLEFAATPDGPDAGAAGVMVWVGRRGAEDRRISDSL